MKKILALIVVCTGILSACKKDPNPTPGAGDVNPIEFTSLEADSDTILLNRSTDITAYVSGATVTYTWTVDIGLVVGSGRTVTFNGCCQGDHHVTCTVDDGEGHTRSKTINIVVVD